MNQEKIGKFIQKCRKEKKITQQELASKLNVTDKAISKWENGRCLMDISLLKPLSEYLDVSIIELINGERIDKNEVSDKSTEIVEKTLNYANKKIKMTKIKAIFSVFVILIVVFSMIFCLYKGTLLYFHRVSNNGFDEIVSGLEAVSTMTIYKKTIDEDKYLTIDDIKIRNDFSNYEVEKGSNELVPDIYRLKDENGKVVSAITIGTYMQLIDAFSGDDLYVMSGDDSTIVDFGQFNAADRKYFLLKNDINNDVDFLNYVKNNGYLKSNLFTSNREIKENYAYNLFVSVALPRVDSVTLINGDYNGYIFNIDDNKIRQVTIIRNNKTYNFLIKGDDLTSDEYIYDLFSTLEIK